MCVRWCTSVFLCNLIWRVLNGSLLINTPIILITLLGQKVMGCKPDLPQQVKVPLHSHGYKGTRQCYVKMSIKNSVALISRVMLTYIHAKLLEATLKKSVYFLEGHKKCPSRIQSEPPIRFFSGLLQHFLSFLRGFIFGWNWRRRKKRRKEKVY